MSSPKNNQKEVPKLSEQEAENLVYEVFKREGKFLPQTDEEVAAAEAAVDEEQIELPPSLRDPMAILGRAPKQGKMLSFPARPVVDAEVVENLACAARNGSEIPPDVLAQMEADEREAAAKREVKDGKE